MSVAHEEFINSLCALINDTNLPMFVIEYVIRDVYSQVKAASEIQCKTEIDNYRKTLAGEVNSNSPTDVREAGDSVTPAELEE